MDSAPSRRPPRSSRAQHAAQQLPGLVVGKLARGTRCAPGTRDERSRSRTHALQLVLGGRRRPRRAPPPRRRPRPTRRRATPTTAHVGDGRVLEQHVLDLARRDVLAAAHDHVVDAALEEQVALLVEEAAVARREASRRGRAARRARGTRRRPARRARRPRPARRPGRGLPSSSRISISTRRQRAADRSQAAPHGGVAARRRRPMVLGSEQRDRGARLREAVGVGEVGLREERAWPARSPGAASCRRRRRGSRSGGARRSWPSRALDDAREHGRHDEGVGHALRPRGRRATPRG